MLDVNGNGNDNNEIIVMIMTDGRGEMLRYVRKNIELLFIEINHRKNNDKKKFLSTLSNPGHTENNVE